jgi:hypothetical protein
MLSIFLPSRRISPLRVYWYSLPGISSGETKLRVAEVKAVGASLTVSLASAANLTMRVARVEGDIALAEEVEGAFAAVME